MPTRSDLPILITAGEPAGIGPDLCLKLAQAHPDIAQRCLIVADPKLLRDRAKTLGYQVEVKETSLANWSKACNELQVLGVDGGLAEPGKLNPDRADYVLETLRVATDAVLDKLGSAIVTAPVHKGIINDAGFAFSGHTEFLADRCAERTDKENLPVMMLATPGLRVALATTHLPLRKVPDAITDARLSEVIETLHRDLPRLGIAKPHIAVCGLNPHAGEDGHLGREEIDVIQPCLNRLRDQGISLSGPLPADTAFTPDKLASHDVFLAMYHDQGLAVLKYKGFGKAVNVTLGLPIIRTSVDHGTALELAGTGKAKIDSLLYAIDVALSSIDQQTPQTS